MKNHQKLLAGLTAVLAVAFAGVMFISNGQLSSLRAKERQNEATISELSAELAKLKKNAEWEAPVELTPEDQEKVSYSAAELGNQIADYQNAYRTLDPSSGDFDANVEALDAFFAEDAKNARTPWYGNAGIPGIWRFVSGGSFKGVEKQVLWLCENPDTGNLLAYATANFNSETNLFDTVSWKMTLEASRGITSSGEPSQSSAFNIGAVNKLADQIKNADVPKERELTEEETGEVKDAQQQLKEKLTGH